jgi:hypothetical protein
MPSTSSRNLGVTALRLSVAKGLKAARDVATILDTSGFVGTKPISRMRLVRPVRGSVRISVIFSTGSKLRVGSRKRHA